MITQQGTKVIPPGGNGPVVNLPPGHYVDTALVMPHQQRPEGVVLPQGGLMTPDVQALLSTGERP
jgi:hypothetical protein